MHSVGHLLQLVLLPPGICLLLLLLGVLVSYVHRTSGKILVCSGLFTLWAFSTPVVSQYLIDRLQYQYPPLQLETLPDKSSQQTIVVLGAGVEMAPEFLSQHNVSVETLARLHYAAYLAKRLGVAVIVSGGNRDQQAATEADVMADTLQQSYRTQILAKEGQSTNTRDESKFILPLIEHYQITRLYLVTHAWHMPRSMYCFTRVFNRRNIDIIPAPMGYITLKTDKGIVNYLPSQHALQVSYYALHEYVGMLYYYFHENIAHISMR